MYRLPLGDCFLLTFPKDDGTPFRLLIDCGLIQGADDPKALMTEVARSLAKETDKVIDLVLVTHEHWDHVSGFHQAREVFDEFTFEELWLAWTEDPKDGLASQLRGERVARREAVARALAQAGAEGAAELGVAHALADFHGLAAAGRPGSTGEALDWIKGKARKTRYCRPGDLLQLPGVSAARVYVLGPPHDPDLIRRSAPSKSHKETYLAEAEDQLRVALTGTGPGLGLAPLTPFDDAYGQTNLPNENHPLFRQDYLNPDDAWRRVDFAWLGMAGPLALQLDSDTNNTSLAVAFELLPGGRVLLFPGDAQVGNWVSWQAIQGWNSPDGHAEHGAADVNDLFARTVLYKVGHHGSHNATLRADGLERMTGPDLLAMIPVDEQFANDTKHWRMPWPDLFAALKSRTAGRILHAVSTSAVPGVRVNATDLFLEVEIPVR
jgi:glyoxylase-like metal-dependent hydrolase (beta-lactamase superfamily II)